LDESVLRDFQDAFTRPEDQVLARTALLRGWVTPQQLETCIQDRSDDTVRLEMLLMSRGWLTQDQLRESRNPGVGAAPARIGHFELVRSLGSGGMANVYLARDSELEREVALKVVHAEPGSEIMQRFHREAVTAARLRHPGIIGVHEVGVQDDLVYIAMDYHDGGTLQHLMKVSDRSRREKLEILRRVADAIGFAHSQGVIHRDVKPGNILLDSRGHPIVADFGLAHVKGTEHRLTTPGMLLGTVAYMSPEQARGEPADERSDVYALGVILYELLAGQIPFVADDPALVLRKILESEPIPPRRLGSTVPADLEAVCLKAMEKEPRRRYGNAKEFADDLRLFLAGEPVRAHGPSAMTRVLRRARKRAPVGFALLAILLVGGGGATIFLKTKAQARKTEERLRLEREEAHRGAEVDRRRLDSQKDLREAVRRLEKACNSYLYQEGADSLDELHRELKAVSALLDRAASDDADLYYARARIAEIRGDFATALRSYGEGLRLHPSNGELLVARARMTFEWRFFITMAFQGHESNRSQKCADCTRRASLLGDPPKLEEVRRDLETARAQGANVSWEPDLAEAMIVGERDKKAGAERLREISERPPHHEIVYLALGEFMIWTGRREEGRAAFDAAIKKRPHYALAYCMRGMTCWMDMKRRETDMLRAVRTAPDFWLGWEALAWQSFGCGQATKGMEYALEALRVEPRNGRAYQLLIEVLTRSTAPVPEPLEAKLGEAIRSMPERWEPYATRSALHRRQGRIGTAILDLEQARERIVADRGNTTQVDAMLRRLYARLAP